MCGIVGYIGHRDAYPVILKGLKRLEYRGYDSAGIALYDGSEVKLSKTKGKVADLEDKISKVNVEMSERTDYESDGYMELITDLNDLNERFVLLGGYTIQSEMSQV